MRMLYIRIYICIYIYVYITYAYVILSGVCVLYIYINIRAYVILSVMSIWMVDNLVLRIGCAPVYATMAVMATMGLPDAAEPEPPLSSLRLLLSR